MIDRRVDLSNPPERFWHCQVWMPGENRPAVVNDLTFEELERTIVIPWRSERAFTVSGTLVQSTRAVKVEWSPRSV